MLSIYKKRTTIFVFVFFIILSVVLTLPYLRGPVDLDEGNYAVIGMMVSRGQTLYVDIADNKTPLIYLVNAFQTLIWGSDLVIERLFLCVFSAFTAFFIYLIGKTIRLDKFSIFGGLFFLFFSSSPAFLFYSPTNVYSSLMETIAVYFLLSSVRVKNIAKTVTVGVFIGLALLFRQTAFLFFVSILLWAFFYYLIKPTFLKNSFFSPSLERISSVDDLSSRFFVALRDFILILFGIFLPFALVFIYFYFQSAIDEMIYWIFFEPGSALNVNNPWTYSLKLEWFSTAFFSSLPLFVFGLFSFKNGVKTYEKLLFGLWFLICFLFIFLGPVPGFTHYYYQLLPPLSLLSVEGLSILIQKINLLKGDII